MGIDLGRQSIIRDNYKKQSFSFFRTVPCHKIEVMAGKKLLKPEPSTCENKAWNCNSDDATILFRLYHQGKAQTFADFWNENFEAFAPFYRQKNLRANYSAFVNKYKSWKNGKGGK